MSELDLTEAIEAAEDAVTAEIGPRPDISSSNWTIAEAAIRAAAPIIERAVREQTEAKIKYLTADVAPALRQLLAAERKRCRQAEDEVDRLLRLIPADAGEAK